MIHPTALFLLLVTLLTTILTTHGEAADNDPIEAVDPFIGTGGTGHCYPGATTPHGMVQLSPDTRDTGWNACGGYHYDDRTILGFSHTHISGTGVEECGDVLLMPTVGAVQIEPGPEVSPELGYRSRFSHDSEVASPGYYAVTLQDDDIRVEATASPRVGVLRITYPERGDANLVIDLNHGLDRQRRYGMPETLLNASLRVVDDRTVVGSRISSGWADLQEVHFVMKFSEPIVAFGMYDAVLRRLVDGLRARSGSYSATKADVRGYVRFAPQPGRPVTVRVGLSSVSIEGAKRNLQAEVDHENFDRVRQEAANAWRRVLNRVEIDAKPSLKTIFYTALYHLHLAPTLLSDVDGKYLGVDHRPAVSNDDYYTTLSLWDTFRAVKPLYTILEPELTAAIATSMLDHHDRQGYLPMWTAWGNETHAMLGNHAIPILTEAVLKGIKGVDPQRAWEAVRQTSRIDHHASPFTMLEKHGYFPHGLVPWSVSQTVEVAYDDACAAKLASYIGEDQEADHLQKRSLSYRQLFDPETGVMRPRLKSKEWVTPFSPESIAHGSAYKEGNAIQYSWFVPQDPAGLAELLGGRESMADRLDWFFSARPQVLNEVSDVTGFLGHYAHGNEVSHHAAYLFNRVGRPERTQEVVAEIRERFYSDRPDGLVGNEDCGQLSAWYVFSALGFYPIDPCSLTYDLGLPAFDRAVIRLPNGERLLILADGVGDGRRRVERVTLNGHPLLDYRLSHADLIGGGELRFVMADGLSPSP